MFIAASFVATMFGISASRSVVSTDMFTLVRVGTL